MVSMIALKRSSEWHIPFKDACVPYRQFGSRRKKAVKREDEEAGCAIKLKRQEDLADKTPRQPIRLSSFCY